MLLNVLQKDCALNVPNKRGLHRFAMSYRINRVEDLIGL